MQTAGADEARIVRRDRQIGRSGYAAEWHRETLARTFYNALSTTFPEGEKFFVESVKRFRHQVDETLARQIEDFVYQESIHAREHVVFNRAAAEHGLDAAAAEARVREMLDDARRLPPYGQLALTAGLEHCTASLAAELLANPKHMAAADAEGRRLWTWHTLEELEHKAVAYDTYMTVGAKLSRFSRWTIRVRTMLLGSKNLVELVAKSVGAQLNSAPARPGRGAVATFLFLNPGIVRRLLPRYLLYFLPGFHPRWSDDRAIVRRTRQTIDAEVVEASPRT